MAEQIKSELVIARKSSASDLVLVIDDLHCNDARAREKLFLDAVDKVPGNSGIKKQVGFAAPEIESWLIADWDNTFGNDIDFRSRHKNMQWWLSRNGVSFNGPESFSRFDPAKDTCEEKLSELIIEASQRDGSKIRFSKGIHTPRLLMNINPDTVCGKCPHFRVFFLNLKQFCERD